MGGRVLCIRTAMEILQTCCVIDRELGSAQGTYGESVHTKTREKPYERTIVRASSLERSFVVVMVSLVSVGCGGSLRLVMRVVLQV